MFCVMVKSEVSHLVNYLSPRSPLPCPLCLLDVDGSFDALLWSFIQYFLFASLTYILCTLRS